ncbi:MAG: N-formylglutamate amidohydrolase [Polyangiales bacterium]
MLRAHEPAPFEIVRVEGASRVVLVCDHASNRLPEALGDLGVAAHELATHIASDLGAAKVARHLSAMLDATLVLSGYSRLVVDCNRPSHVAGAIPVVTGGVGIPGNDGLDERAREARIATFFTPYHEAIARLLDERTRSGRDPVLLSIHSFTPSLLGQARPWPIALLYGRDTRLAHAFRDRLRRDPSLNVGDNEPYRVSDETDHTVPVHGERRGLLHTAFEIRQDGVADDEGAHAWAHRIATIAREIEIV